MKGEIEVVTNKNRKKTVISDEKSNSSDKW